jgi:Tol biopolymer transport system component
LNGTQGNDNSGTPVITPDGRYVAYWTQADNLFPGDTNNSPDVLVYDRDSDNNGIYDEPGKVSLTSISISTDGSQSGGGYHNLDISADGRYVAFTASGWDGHYCAYGSNYYLCSDIYVHDRLTGQTILVSKGWDGLPTNGRTFHPAISADGRFISFYGEVEANNLVPGAGSGMADVYLYDRQTGLTTRISNGIGNTPASGGIPANGDSTFPSISGDGRYVAYQSLASNLVVGDANGFQDIFLTDASLNRPETVQTNVLPEVGGSLVDALSGFNLQIPANAVESPVTVSYTTPIWLIHPLAAGERTVRVFLLEAVTGDGTPVTHFLAPYSMQIDFTLAQLEALAVPIDSLRLVYWAGAAWQEVPSSLDTTNHHLTVTADHFSQFALVGTTHSIFLPLVMH